MTTTLVYLLYSIAPHLKKCFEVIRDVGLAYRSQNIESANFDKEPRPQQ